MIIRKTRVFNPQRYLYALHLGDAFYIATPLEEEDYPLLEAYGLQVGYPSRIPVPRRSATTLNADGRWKLRRDLPKEPRHFSHSYHLVDWGGHDHYGTCWQMRWCYQRELIPPTELAFMIEDGVLYSPLMTNEESEVSLIKIAMNVMLEMLGRCEIWTAERVPAIPPVKQAEVPWEILRAGIRAREEWEEYVGLIVARKSKTQQALIRERHEHLWQMKPDFCVLGTQNFWGYVVYGFTELNLFVFECNDLNNATYVFKGDWTAASQLTKTEVLSGHMHEARIYHTENWYANIRKLIADARKEVA